MQHCFWTGDEMKNDLETYFWDSCRADPASSGGARLPTTSTMQAKSPAEADARIDPPLLLGRMQASAPANAAVAKVRRHPCVDSGWQLAAMGLEPGGLFLATPLQTLERWYSWHPQLHSGSVSCSVRCA